MLDKLFSFLKILFIALLIFVFCALVWWGGPELRIGDSRPLEPVGWRLFVMSLPLMFYLIPLVVRFYKWMWQQLGTKEVESEPDHLLQDCKLALKKIRAKKSQSHGVLAYLRFWFSGPDIIFDGDNTSLTRMLHQWPYPVVWDSGETDIGRFFYSNGLVWLYMPESAWVPWAKAMRWKNSPRSLVWVVDSNDWQQLSIRSDLIKSFQTKLSAWQKYSFRSIPYWLYFSDIRSPAGTSGWSANEISVPYGFSLPSSIKFNSFNWKKLAQNFLDAMQASVVIPNLSIASSQAKLHLYFECKQLIETSRTSLSHLPNLRGVFWLWAGSQESLVGWKGFLRIIQKDFASGFLRTDISLLKKITITVFTFFLFLTFVDQTFFRIDRHTFAFNEWLRLRPSIEREFEQVISEPEKIRPVLTSLETLEALSIDSQELLGESLNDLAKQAIAERQSNLVLNYLTPRLHQVNLDCVRSSPVLDAERVFQASRFLLMLNQPAHSDLGLMKKWLEICQVNGEQADMALAYWKRHASPQNLSLNQLKLWRSQLNNEFAYNISNHIWSRIVESANGPEVKNFSLSDALGPSATWFSNAHDVPFLFTSQGYVNYFSTAPKNFPQWVKEYQWVMGLQLTTLSRNDFESLKSLSNSRYVESAIHDWDLWFAGLRLNRVDGVLQAADRANLFGSEDSPITLLLTVLEENIPLPRTKTVHFLDRMKSRVSDDWANLQYQFGWRAHAKASVNPNDPRRAIGQHYVILRRFFPDKNGKSSERDRLLSSINQIGQYLTQSDASSEAGVKTANSSILKRIQIQAAQLPKPLKEITLALVSNSEGELQKDSEELFAMEMRNLPSFKVCQLNARYPLQLQARDEMLWREFVNDFSSQGQISKLVNAQSAMIDTSKSPWKFKSTSLGPTQISHQDMKWLEKASKISQAWFPDSSTDFTFFVRPVNLQSTVRVARIRFDDQYWTYSHGQQFAQKFVWSNNSNVPSLEMELVDIDGKTSKFKTSGPWSLLRWAQTAVLQTTNDPSKILLDFHTDVGHLQLEISTLETSNPLNTKLYEQLCR